MTTKERIERLTTRLVTLDVDLAEAVRDGRTKDANRIKNSIHLARRRLVIHRARMARE